MNFTANGTTDCGREISTSKCNCSSYFCSTPNLHWSLDVAFNEDACRVRKDEGPANLACLRRIAQTQLKRETALKVGMANKRARAGWDQTYLLKVLMLGVL